MKKPSNRLSTTRRRFLKLAALTVGATAVGGGWHAYDLQVTRKDVWVPALPPAWEGTRVLHLSDMHRGPFVQDFYLEKVMEQARGLSYDLVALTGDFIAWSSGYADGLKPLLSNLNAPLAPGQCWETTSTTRPGSRAPCSPRHQRAVESSTRSTPRAKPVACRVDEWSRGTRT